MAGPPAGLVGRRTRIRPLAAGDVDWVWDEASSSGALSRWRFRGFLPAPHAFVEALWASADASFVIEASEHRRVVGLTQLFGADLHNGCVSLAAMVPDDLWNTGWPLEGVLLTVQWAFELLPIRKMYIEATEPVAERFASASSRFMRREAVLSAHQYLEGRWVDVHIYSVSSDTVDLDLIRKVTGARMDGRT